MHWQCISGSAPRSWTGEREVGVESRIAGRSQRPVVSGHGGFHGAGTGAAPGNLRAHERRGGPSTRLPGEAPIVSKGRQDRWTRRFFSCRLMPSNTDLRDVSMTVRGRFLASSAVIVVAMGVTHTLAVAATGPGMGQDIARHASDLLRAWGRASRSAQRANTYFKCAGAPDKPHLTQDSHFKNWIGYLAFAGRAVRCADAGHGVFRTKAHGEADPEVGHWTSATAYSDDDAFC
jgi:hypothetical protein